MEVRVQSFRMDVRVQFGISAKVTECARAERHETDFCQDNLCFWYMAAVT